ncbi:MAG: PAS domain S-box protein, partial [Candidatus Hermodarchaeota archaeon]
KDLIGTHLINYIHTDDKKYAIEVLKKHITSGEGKAELRVRKKNGDYIWVEIRGKTFIDRNGAIKGLTTSSDITERKVTEQKLKESELKYRHLFESSPYSIGLFNSNGILIDCNSRTKDFISISDTENIIGKHYLELFSLNKENKLVKPLLNEYNEKILSGHKVKSIEFPFKKRDGDSIWVSLMGSLIKIGDLTAFQFIVEDITERKKAEERIKESELKYRHLFESSPYVIGIMDLDGNVVDMNTATNQLLTNRTKRDLIGKNISYIFSIADEEKPIIQLIEQQIKNVKNNKSMNSFEFPFIRSNGQIQWVDFQGSNFKIKNQTFIQFIIRDITEKKKSDEDLKQSEKKFRRIFESIPDIYFLVSSESVILDSKGRKKDLWVTPEEFFGKKLIDILPQDLGQKSLDTIKNTIKTKRPTILEYNLPYKGEIRYFEARHLYFSQDQVAIFIRDITERKNAELLVQEEFIKLKELDQIRKDLVSRVSHELKTPLIPVLSGAELLSTIYKDQLGKDAIEIIKMIDKGGTRLKELIEKLINVSRIEYNKLQLNKRKSDLSGIIRTASDDMKYLLEKRNLTLNLNIPDIFYLEIDDIRIEEVITNLLSNAINNTPPEGIISIKLSIENNFVLIIVKDTGVGLTGKEMERLFTRFGKIERYQKGLEYIDIKGSGLGLYICKKLLELHGGQIWAESDGRNKGSTFIVKLPINYP